MTTANTIRAIGAKLKMLLPSGYHFTLVIYPKSRQGLGNYLSSAPIEESILALRKTAEKLEKMEVLPTIESN